MSRHAPAMARAYAATALAALLLALPAAGEGRAPGGPSATASTVRAVAFTFDDLPATRLTSLAEGRAITERLLARLRKLAIPATGFVNETKLDDVPGEEEARAALLAAWLDAGHDLGNHTYSHARLYDTPLATVEAEVLRGERVLRPMMAARGRRPRYFRHPTLNTGPDLATKAAFERFLDAHGYRVAPVTIDSDEYLYALAYDRARARADTLAMQGLARDYVRYMEDVFGHDEALSTALLGREPAQILLLHANALNADHLGDLAAMIRRRGYRFVSLDQALADSVYRRRDTYVGARGPSWLERWAITEGQPAAAPPEIPAWVREATR